MAANRPKGRSLAEFSPLSVAETKIRDAAAAGEMAKIGATRPEEKNANCEVRADFLRFLALGGDDQAPVHEKGLQVRGAWITGKLDLSYAEIAGALKLVKCHFAERLAFNNTHIKGLFSLEGSTVPGLRADRLICPAGVFLRNGFSSTGEVRLLGANIGGNLSCRGGEFGSNNYPAVNGQGMSVSGAFIFDGVKIVGGAVNVSGAHVARLVDDLKSWPQNSVLDGFVYGSFAGDAPTAAKDRLAWLERQSPEHSGAAKNPREFRPQPWIQLRKVLREMGHLEDARQVAIAFENRKRECGVIGEIAAPITYGKLLGRHTACIFHRLYGALIGYGYRPAKLFWILVAVWLSCTLLFYAGAHNRVFGPTDLTIAQNPAYDQCNPEKTPRANWTRCKTMPRAYPAFYPPIYALDVLLPIAKLGQQDRWAPLAPSGAHATDIWLLAWATQFAVWLEIAFGWIAGLLLVATISGLAKRNED